MAKMILSLITGVLGQKWGVRRYQNEDGSLTDKGKKHYLKTQEKAAKLLKSLDDQFGEVSINDLNGGTVSLEKQFTKETTN